VKIFLTHPDFAYFRSSTPKVTPVAAPPPVPLPIAPVNTSTDLEALLPSFKNREEVFEYVGNLGDLALNAANQKIDFSEEDKNEILHIIEILENEPEQLAPGSDLIEIKTFIMGEYVKRITIQMVFNFQNKGKEKKLN
jgi:hypothetical protein